MKEDGITPVAMTARSLVRTEMLYGPVAPIVLLTRPFVMLTLISVCDAMLVVALLTTLCARTVVYNTWLLAWFR